MYELISNLILYGNLPKNEILVQLAKLLSDDEKSYYPRYNPQNVYVR